MIKILLVATVVSSFMIDEIGQITKFDSAQISTIAVLMVEIVFVFGAHSWVRGRSSLAAWDSVTTGGDELTLSARALRSQLKNVVGGLMALIDEQIKSGSHIRFQGHEGVVERLYLQCFSLRQYDKGLAYIPNGILLENTVEIQSKRLDRRCVVAVHLSHRTASSSVRLFIQELDNFLLHLHAEKQARRKAKVTLTLGSSSKRGEWDTPSNKRSADDDEDQSSGRFWISIEDSYTVHVVYYTHERHIKQIMEEKTEVRLGHWDSVCVGRRLTVSDAISSSAGGAADHGAVGEAQPGAPRRRGDDEAVVASAARIGADESEAGGRLQSAARSRPH